MKNYVHITVYSPPSSRVSRSSPEPERKRMHLSQIPETEKVGVKQRSRKKGHKARLSRLLLSKECIPWSWHGLRWHKWGKRGGHSCGLITLMETLPFCQGLQKTFRNASSSRSEKNTLVGAVPRKEKRSWREMEHRRFLLIFTLNEEGSCV